MILWLLSFLPVLFFAVSANVTQIQTVTAADADLSPALRVAVKAAAMQVTGDSQAVRDPRIHPARALAAFRETLAANLGLDPVTLAPRSGSLLKAPPSFVLVVYNGNNAFQPGGARAAVKYVFHGSGAVVETSFVPHGFPYSFSVRENDIVPGSTLPIHVRMDRPGVIAVAGTNMARIIGSEEIRPARWAAARIVVP